MSVRIGEQEPNELQRGRIGKVQIIEKQDQRMLRAGELAEEVLKQQAEAVLRLGRGQGRDCRLGTDDQLELGQELDQDLAVFSQRMQEALFAHMQGVRRLGQRSRRRRSRQAPSSGP